MGNCFKKKQRRKIVLLLIGLDNAGKTVTVKGLAGENQDDSIPTVGFSTISLKYLDTCVTIYDLGGGKDIRGIWPTYFVDAHGVIFVIDSSDFNRLDEAKSVLYSVLSNEKISGKPILLLANKQDSDDALDELDLAEKLQLEKLVNEQKCPTLIESCAAQQKRKKIDPGIKNGYRWLLNCIMREYDSLNERVLQDIYEQKIVAQERRKNIVKVNSLFENDPIEVKSNPFKPIGEIVSKNRVKTEKRKVVERNGSATSTKSYLVIKKPIKNKRPKSAVDIVKRQLEKSKRRNTIFVMTSNKTAPVNLFTPKRESDENNSNTNSSKKLMDTKNSNKSSDKHIQQNNVSMKISSANKLTSPKTISDAPNYTSEKIIRQYSTNVNITELPGSAKMTTDESNFSSNKNNYQNGMIMNPLNLTELPYPAKMISDSPNFFKHQNGVMNSTNNTELPTSTRTVTVLPNSTSVIVETHVDLFAVNNFKPQNKNVPSSFKDENWVEKTTKRKNIQEDLDIIMKDVS